MSHVYDSASTRTIPAMQARAQIARQRRREEADGVMQLPGLDEVPPASRTRRPGYDHVPPWEPPEPADDHLDLTGEADIDPDAFDPSEWEDDHP
jgi:hypothetical protein